MYRSPQFEQNRQYSLTVHPHDFSVHVDNTLINASLDDGSTIFFSPDQVQLQNISGQYEDNSFNIAGSIAYAPTMDFKLEFDHNGPLNNPQARVLFPQRIRNILDAVQYEDGSRTHLRNCAIQARRYKKQDESGTSLMESPAPQWDVDFSGHLDMELASFNPGIDFTDITGHLDINVRHVPGEPDDMMILAHLDRMLVLGNELHNTDALLQLSDDGTHIELSEYRGDSHGGVINAQASIGVGDHLEGRRRLLD